MATKIIIYLLIGIIVGSTLGFGGGYGIYSPQISNLSKKLNTTETKYAELLSSNQLLLNQKDELQIRYTNATNLVADLQNQLNDKDTQIINLQNKINQYINEQNILQSKILDLENKLQVILEGPELTIYPDNGTYPQPLEITMKSSIDGSMLYYTLDGSEPSISSKKYEEPIKINDIGEVTIKAIGVSLYRAGSIMTKKYTIVDSNPLLGEVGGLHYVTWNFNKNNFRKLDVTIKIYEEPSLGDGLYFQMYQGMINGVGFYFGFQTDVYKPGVGSAGKGIIFSRWGTNDLSNVRIVDGGWSQSAGYEGDFVGVRVNYVWSTHTYKMSVRYIESDAVGDWYGVWVTDMESMITTHVGSIRFPANPNQNGIQDNGITWTELYYKKDLNTPIPSWHVSILNIFADDSFKPVHAYSSYSQIEHTDIFHEISNDEIHFFMGIQVARKHNPGMLY